MRAIRGVLLATMAFALLLPATAMGQASRTYVSGTGNDGSPCSRSAPCLTFAQAHNSTAPGGEINVLDSGGFGGLTITKSITIRAEGATAGVLVSGTNGIVVNAAATDSVTLDGLDINGLGTGSPTSLSGVKVLSAARVRIENSDIYRFKAGIAFVPTSANTKLIVDDVRIHDNGIGIFTGPGSAAGTGQTALVKDSQIEGNTCGAVVSTTGSASTTPDATVNTCGVNSGSPLAPSSMLKLMESSISDNAATGVFANGAGAKATISEDVITGNGTGLQTANDGQIVSLGGNDIFDNGTDGAPTASIDTKKGLQGDPGPPGLKGDPGERGPAGANGANGKVRLVTCRFVRVTIKVKGERRRVRRKRCRTKLVTGPVTFTTTGAPKTARATLTRAGRVYARGSALITRAGTSVAFPALRSLRTGSYQLKLWRHGRLVAQRRVVVR